MNHGAKPSSSSLDGFALARPRPHGHANMMKALTGIMRELRDKSNEVKAARKGVIKGNDKTAARSSSGGNDKTAARSSTGGNGNGKEKDNGIGKEKTHQYTQTHTTYKCVLCNWKDCRGCMEVDEDDI